MSEDERETAQTGRQMDPEARVIHQLVKILDPMDPKARRRLMAYLGHRYADAEARHEPNPVSDR